MRKLQLADPEIRVVLMAKEAQAKPSADVQKAHSLATRKLFQIWDQLLIRDGVLFRQWENPTGSRSVLQLVMPKSERTNVLRDLHEGVAGGHLGEAKVLEKLKERFYWPAHAKEVNNWCQTCSTCAQRKHLAHSQNRRAEIHIS